MLKSVRLRIASLLLICSPSAFAWTQCESATAQQVQAWSQMIKGIDVWYTEEPTAQDLTNCEAPTEAQLGSWRDALDYWSFNRSMSSDDVLSWAVKTGLAFPGDESVDLNDLRVMRYNASKVAGSLYDQTQKASIDLFNLQNGWYGQPYEQFVDTWQTDWNARTSSVLEAHNSYFLDKYSSIDQNDASAMSAYRAERETAYQAVLSNANLERSNEMNSRYDAYQAQNATAIASQQSYVASLTQQLNEAAGAYRIFNDSANNAYRASINGRVDDGIAYWNSLENPHLIEQNFVISRVEPTPAPETAPSASTAPNRLNDQWSDQGQNQGMYR